ncbi:MAG: tandem-95 repeat protein [Phycisphaerae bacterium]|nr:tandem-95 repeat protein [Phycisphaerae bacterium]
MKGKLIVFAALVALAVAAIVALLVISANDPPIAESCDVATQEDTPTSIVIAGSDEDADQLTFSVTTGPSHGRLSGTVPALTYSPDTNFNGSDSFSFKVNDGEADSEVAAVSIKVSPVNDSPKAYDDSVKTQEDAPIATVKVLANDTDPDDDKLMVINATQGTNGSVTIGVDSTLAYTPDRNFSGTDTFTYQLSDGKGGNDTATVNVTIDPVNDAPSITSKPSETTRVWASYVYDVEAKDPDQGDSLIYALTKKPKGMTIDRDTGLIEWRPTSAQAGAFDIAIRVFDSNMIRAWDTQTFTVSVTSLSSPLTNTLTVADCFNQKGSDTLSAKDKISVVEASNDSRMEIEPRSYTCYKFGDASIPAGASIVSIIVYVEHFEELSFQDGKLLWSVGTGWPDKPVVWASTNAPVRRGQNNEAKDGWDVTSSVDTPEKANSLCLQIKNDDTANRKTLVDSVGAVVKWY